MPALDTFGREVRDERLAVPAAAELLVHVEVLQPRAVLARPRRVGHEPQGDAGDSTIDVDDVAEHPRVLAEERFSEGRRRILHRIWFAFILRERPDAGLDSFFVATSCLAWGGLAITCFWIHGLEFVLEPLW